MWFDQAVVYQIYPLGLCGAPAENDGVQAHRILWVLDWVEHIKALGADTVLFNPLFDSDRHGYDTRDYFTVDPRLGTEEDLKRVCDALHAAGLRVMLDGVFNHVGRGFWAFRDVLEKRERSPYRDWFRIDFGGDTGYHDGLWYESWEGHYELVKLNLGNPDVVRHQFDAIRSWVDRFGIDGLRLDVAYCLSPDYLRQLRAFTEGLKPDFPLMGECLHGDYNRWMGPELCHSVTNYECHKGLWSAFNSMNLFEIGHSIQRQFGADPWCLYRGRPLLNFLDNHDVEGDAALRPAVEKPVWNELTDFIAALAAARRRSPALCYGAYRTVLLTNRQYIFERAAEGERVLVSINADSAPYTAHFDAGCGRAVDLITGALHDFGGGSQLPPYSAAYWKMEK